MNKQQAESNLPRLVAYLQSQGMLNANKNPRPYSCNNKIRWEDTVDGNPRAAYTEAHPYTGNVTVSGRVGINGKVGGSGCYGD